MPTHQPQPTGWRRAVTVAVLAVGVLAVVVAATGCSSGQGSQAGPGSSPVASLPGHPGGAAPAASPLTVAGSDQDMISFTRCMRAHHVSMPEPFHRPGHQGLSIELPPQDAATQVAYRECTHFIQPIISMKQAGQAAQVARQLPALTRYAHCMRGHNINMLDPTQEGQLNLGNVPGITSDFGRYSPQFRTADAACRHLLPAGVHDNGTGP
jgi:hypothetical protein